VTHSYSPTYFILASDVTSSHLLSIGDDCTVGCEYGDQFVGVDVTRSPGKDGDVGGFKAVEEGGFAGWGEGAGAEENGDVCFAAGGVVDQRFEEREAESAGAEDEGCIWGCHDELKWNAFKYRNCEKLQLCGELRSWFAFLHHQRSKERRPIWRECQAKGKFWLTPRNPRHGTTSLHRTSDKC
jgi:hypothetical protein